MIPSPQFRLIDHGWKAEFDSASNLKTDELLAIAQFIRYRTVQQLTVRKKRVCVLTRFSLRDFVEGVSGVRALSHVLETGGEVRGIKNLHAKMYVFGELRAIVTSANLTEAALTRNHDLGFVAEKAALVCACREYFERLWKAAGAQGGVLTAKTPRS